MTHNYHQTKLFFLLNLLSRKLEKTVNSGADLAANSRRHSWLWLSYCSRILDSVRNSNQMQLIFTCRAKMLRATPGTVRNCIKVRQAIKMKHSWTIIAFNKLSCTATLLTNIIVPLFQMQFPWFKRYKITSIVQLGMTVTNIHWVIWLSTKVKANEVPMNR